VVDPIGLVPIYIGLTFTISSQKQRGQIINKAVGVAFVILSLFIVAGKYILNLLQIDAGSFFIAGGIMLFIISLEMLFGRPTGTKISGNEGQDDLESGVSVAVFPLAIPMLAGPGSITTIILFTGSKDAGLPTMVMLFIALILTLAAVWLTLRASNWILQSLGRTGVSVLQRIMGLLLSGLSVQFVYNGILKLGFLR
jgi:multiple antibiotic resistance protein